MSKRKSFPLDLSARAYPLMKTRRSQSNFRFSAMLDAAIDPESLLRALTEVLPHYPNLNARIISSFFWHKFADNPLPPIVKEDDRPPLQPLKKEDTNRYPFRLAYREKEIILEIFHAATDGNVGALFFSDILTRYVALKEAIPAEYSPRSLRVEDAFLSYGKKKKLSAVSLGKYNGSSVLALGEKKNYRTSPLLLSHEVSLCDLKERAKNQHATLTEYLAACYLAAILKKEPLPLKKPVCLFLPIDLRRFFPSDTLQNFVCFERITLPKGTADTSFLTILEQVKTQFREKITQEGMQQRIDDVLFCFQLPVLNYLPLFLKSPSFRLCKRIMNKVRQTAILSNVGSVTLPPEAAKHVLSVKFFLNINKNAPLNVAILTYGTTCNLDITCGLKETDIPERFFAMLDDQGKK